MALPLCREGLASVVYSREVCSIYMQWTHLTFHTHVHSFLDFHLKVNVGPKEVLSIAI
jgi:hypothetical protein